MIVQVEPRFQATHASSLRGDVRNTLPEPIEAKMIRSDTSLGQRRHATDLHRLSRGPPVVTGCTVSLAAFARSKYISEWPSLHLFHFGVIVGAHLTLGSSDIAKFMNELEKAFWNGVKGPAALVVLSSQLSRNR